MKAKSISITPKCPVSLLRAQITTCTFFFFLRLQLHLNVFLITFLPTVKIMLKVTLTRQLRQVFFLAGAKFLSCWAKSTQSTITHVLHLSNLNYENSHCRKMPVQNGRVYVRGHVIEMKTQVNKISARRKKIFFKLCTFSGQFKITSFQQCETLYECQCTHIIMLLKLKNKFFKVLKQTQHLHIEERITEYDLTLEHSKSIKSRQQDKISKHRPSNLPFNANSRKRFKKIQAKKVTVSPVQNVLKGLCYPSLFIPYERWLEDNFWSSNSFCPNKELVIRCQVKHGL